MSCFSNQKDQSLSATSDERRLWETGGAQSLSSLTGPAHEE
jgi:hypothetical protein